MDFIHSIRPALPNDTEDIIAMMKELADHKNMLDQYKLTAEQLREDAFGKDPVFQCLVAEVSFPSSGDVKTVGYALFYYIYSTFKGKNVYLQDLYIKEPFRKGGIGGDLVNTVAKIGLGKGCKQYRSACLGWNTLALNFFKASGARDLTELEDWHMIRFDKEGMHAFADKLGKK